MALELKSTQFRREREGTWRELEKLVERAEKSGVETLDGASLTRLPTLYRATLSSLSVARAVSLDRNLLNYLEALCARAYLSVYGVRERPLSLLLAFFAWRLPIAVRAAWRPIAIAALVMLAGTLSAWWLTVHDPSYYGSFVGEMEQGRNFQSTPEQLHQSLQGTGNSGQLGAFAAYLFSRNAGIGMLSFALGFMLGIPTLILTFVNGLTLGAFLALHQSKGLLLEFAGWLSIHGPTELTSLVLAGAAGLKLASAILFAGREPRLTRLARDGRDAAVIVMGAVLLLFLAGLLEGIGRQTILDTLPRFLIGWSVWGAIVAYFCLAGRAHR